MYAVVLAGGRGERFWPYSREKCPKQFLKLLGERTMLQQTVDRLTDVVEPENIFVITGSVYLDLVREQLPWIPGENIIGEPCGRDTAPAVGLGAVLAARKDPRGVMLVLPADHYIHDLERFRQVVLGAANAASRGDDLVTIGICPTRPETGYGYVKQGELHDSYGGVPAYRVDQFTEKPDYDNAVEFIFRGDYLWNSGMFVWRVDVIRRLIGKFLPQLELGLKDIERVLDDGDIGDVLKDVYPGLPKISVDYAIMEKTDRVLVVPGDFGWDDVGSWTALERHREADQMNNVIDARGVFLETRGCLVSSPRVVATLGLENMIIVDDRDCLLICPKEKAQEIKKVVNALKDLGFSDLA